MRIQAVGAVLDAESLVFEVQDNNDQQICAFGDTESPTTVDGGGAELAVNCVEHLRLCVDMSLFVKRHRFYPSQRQSAVPEPSRSTTEIEAVMPTLEGYLTEESRSRMRTYSKPTLLLSFLAVVLATSLSHPFEGASARLLSITDIYLGQLI